MSRIRSPLAPREPKPVTETPDGLRLHLRDLSGHLAFDTRSVVAWYRLAPVAYNYLTRDEQERIFADMILALAGLVGRGEFHMRTLPRPFAPYQWAAGRADYLNRLGLTSPCPDEQTRRAIHDQEYLGSVDLGEYETYLGVTVGSAPDWRAQLREAHSAAKLSATVGEVDRAIARPGLAGAPVTALERDWLIDRSVGLFLPPPVRLPFDEAGPSDMFTFTDGVEVDPWPDEHDCRRRRAPKAVRYLGWLDGKPVERWVCVLSLGRHQDLLIPERHQPWIAYAQQLPFPVEWSLRGIVLSPEEARKRITKQIKLFREQAEQLHEESTPDPGLTIAHEAAIRRQHEMSEGTPERGCEARWVARLAVAGPTEQVALKRAKSVIEHYARYDMAIEHPQGQAALAREFIPGEPQASVAHTRTTGLDFLAVGLPTMSAKLGDDVGPYLGYTTGLVRHRVMWDPWRALVVSEAPGLVPVIGEPGAGKSALLGAVAEEAIVAGVATTVVQMAGSLERVARLPHLRDACSVFDVRTAKPGALSPYVVIPDPRRDHIAQDPKVTSKPEWERRDLIEAIWSDRMLKAEQARGALAFDDLWHVLPPAEQTPLAERLLTKAIREAPRTRAGALDYVVDALRDLGEAGQDLAERLFDLGQLHSCSLYFRPGRDDAYDETATGVFLSMAGAALPEPGQPPRTREQRLNLPLFHNAVHLAARRVYELPPLQPKLFEGDEIGLSGGWSSGEALFTRLGVDARKLNLRLMLGSQAPDWVLRLDVDSLVDDVFAGRSHPRTAEKTLSLLQIEPEPWAVRELTGLSPRRADGTRGPREFLARLNGRVERMVVDLAHRPDLLAALTPGAPIPGDMAAA